MKMKKKCFALACALVMSVSALPAFATSSLDSSASASASAEEATNNSITFVNSEKYTYYDIKVAFNGNSDSVTAPEQVDVYFHSSDNLCKYQPHMKDANDWSARLDVLPDAIEFVVEAEKVPGYNTNIVKSGNTISINYNIAENHEVKDYVLNVYWDKNVVSSKATEPIDIHLVKNGVDMGSIHSVKPGAASSFTEKGLDARQNWTVFVPSVPKDYVVSINGWDVSVALANPVKEDSKTSSPDTKQNSTPVVAPIDASKDKKDAETKDTTKKDAEKTTEQEKKDDASKTAETEKKTDGAKTDSTAANNNSTTTTGNTPVKTTSASTTSTKTNSSTDTKTPSSDTKASSTTDASNTKNSSPKTGDERNLTMWITIAVIAVVACIGGVFAFKKTKPSDNAIDQ